MQLLSHFRLMPQSGSGWRQVRTFLLCDRGALTVELVAIALVLAIGAIAITGAIMEGLATPACGVVQQLSPGATCGS
jgi:hypothetical protein